MPDEVVITKSSDSISMELRIPKQIQWTPQEDITAHEIALVLPILLGMVRPHVLEYWEDHIALLPENVRRHFTIG